MYNGNTMSDAPAPARSETALDTRRPAILTHAVVPRGPQPPASPNCSHRPSRRQCSAPAPAACVATLTRQSASAPPCPHACVACAEKNGPPEKTSEAGSDACSFSGRTRRASWWVPQPPRPNAALPRRLLKTSSIGIVALQHNVVCVAARRSTIVAICCHATACNHHLLRVL